MSATFWDRFADRYARQPIKDQASYDEKLRLITGLLTPQSRVLDIGCGTGGMAAALAPFAAQVVGIDSSEKMLDYARAKARGVANLRLVQTDLAGFEETGFDVILALSLLHLLPDWRGMIAEIYARLPEGGAFVSNTVCIADASWKLRLLLPLGARLRLMPPLQCFSQPALETALRDAGFELEKVWNPGGGKTAFIIARKPRYS